MPPNEKLASREVVRPLPGGHPAIDLILRLLMWDPGSRLPAAEALQHPFFGVDPAPIVGSPAGPRLGPSSRRSGAEGSCVSADLRQGSSGAAASPGEPGHRQGRPSGGPSVSADPDLDAGVPVPSHLTSEPCEAAGCQCLGNCGRAACSTRQTRRQRGTVIDGCGGACRRGSKYCEECACGVADCRFLRSNKDG